MSSRGSVWRGVRRTSHRRRSLFFGPSYRCDRRRPRPVGGRPAGNGAPFASRGGRPSATGQTRLGRLRHLRSAVATPRVRQRVEARRSTHACVRKETQLSPPPPPRRSPATVPRPRRAPAGFPPRRGARRPPPRRRPCSSLLHVPRRVSVSDVEYWGAECNVPINFGWTLEWFNSLFVVDYRCR